MDAMRSGVCGISRSASISFSRMAMGSSKSSVSAGMGSIVSFQDDGAGAADGFDVAHKAVGRPDAPRGCGADAQPRTGAVDLHDERDASIAGMPLEYFGDAPHQVALGAL